MINLQIDFIERGGRTQRMHTVPTLHSQNVAAHSFGVAWWCWLLSGQKPSAALLMAALQHDLAEHATGDIPAPTKRKLKVQYEVAELEQQAITETGMPDYAELLTESEVHLLKLADCFELMQHCVRERVLGNRCKQVLEMYINVRSYIKQEGVITDLEKDCFSYIQSNFEEAMK